ncbi:MAG: O-antigen ligase family protein, partial [Fusobacteriaceae bacterium]
MYNKLKEKINIRELVYYLIIVYLFFLFRRGGDSKFKMALVVSLGALIVGYKEKFQSLKKYKVMYIFGMLYLLSLSVTFYLSQNKEYGRVSEFLGMTLYSVIFFLSIINIKLKDKEYLRLIPIATLFSIETIVRGMQELYLNRTIINFEWFRLSGRTYTTIYAAELGICIMIGLVGIYIYQKKSIKLFYGVYTILLLILLYYTRSRNSMLMIPIAVCLITFLKVKKNKMVVTLIGLLVIGFMLKKAPEIKGLSRLSTLGSIETIKQDARFNIFKEGMKIGKKNLLKGKGFYAFKEGTLSIEGNTTSHPHTHNFLIETFATQGLITLISYLLFLSSIIFYSVKNYFSEKNNLIKDIKFLTIGVFTFGLLYGLAEAIFYFTKIYMM